MEMATEAKATMEEVVANMDNQTKFKKGQLITATISSADDTGVAVLLPNTKKEVMLDKAEVDCEVYNKDEFNAKTGEEIELMVITVTPRVVLSQKQIKQVKEEEAMLALEEIMDSYGNNSACCNNRHLAYCFCVNPDY